MQGLQKWQKGGLHSGKEPPSFQYQPHIHDTPFPSIDSSTNSHPINHSQIFSPHISLSHLKDIQKERIHITNMEPRARAARQKGQLNFEAESTYPSPSSFFSLSL